MPAFAKPLSYLINLSIATSTVPTQWKVASICPVPKIPNPKENADFRPISITSVLSRVTERLAKVKSDYNNKVVIVQQSCYALED